MPTWTKIDGGLPANPTYVWLEPDPWNVSGRQYLVITNPATGFDEIYVRTGGNWSKLTDATALKTLLNTSWSITASEGEIQSIQADINTDGYLGAWVTYDNGRSRKHLFRYFFPRWRWCLLLFH